MPSVYVILWCGVKEDTLSCSTMFRCKAWLEVGAHQESKYGKRRGREEERDGGRQRGRGNGRQEGNPSIKIPPSILMGSEGFCPSVWVGRGCQGRPILGQGQEQRSSVELWLCVRPRRKQPGAPPCTSDISTLSLWSLLAQWDSYISATRSGYPSTQ